LYVKHSENGIIESQGKLEKKVQIQAKGSALFTPKAKEESDKKIKLFSATVDPEEATKEQFKVSNFYT